MTDLRTLPFTRAALHAAYAGGLTPAAVMREALARLEATGDPGIFLSLRSGEDLVSEAEALGPFDPEARPLWGLPFAVKDNIDLAGLPTTAACPAFAYEPEGDAFAVAALRAAGAIPLGKTNLDQFATGLNGTRTPWPVPKNAIDPLIVPGGSSSGSGVAVSHGLVTFALGTDTAGSGRVPAALNNIVGLKPSLGAISSTGMVPACRTLDTISVFALTVEDAWEAYRVACRFDPADGYARPMPAPPLGPLPPGMVIGVPDAASIEFCGDRVQADSFARALARLEAMGARIRPIDVTPFFDVARMLYEGAWVAERMAAIEPLLRDRPDEVLPVIRQIVGAADGLSSADVFRGFYRLADLRRKALPLLDQVDLLCVPTIPTFYTLADLAADPIGPNSRLGTYTNFVNLLDLCGIAVPTGPRRDGRPGSVTLLAPAGQDARIAALASAIHRDAAPAMGATGLPLPPAPAPHAAALPGETVIAAVGAHMSGLPLNRQITKRGGRFLAATRTAPGYRLFVLPGGPPMRPGLLQTGEGGQIALELWAMPTEAVGSFLALIPAPLGLGTVTLEDGRTVTGFLCEASATTGARDITGLGGWRAWLAAG